MKLTSNSQSILITGVTGSGKTETAKHVIQFLCGNDMEDITVMIPMASCILETFGNATTIANENSSRFSKFVEVNLFYNIFEENPAD